MTARRVSAVAVVAVFCAAAAHAQVQPLDAGDAPIEAVDAGSELASEVPDRGEVVAPSAMRDGGDESAPSAAPDAGVAEPAVAMTAPDAGAVVEAETRVRAPRLRRDVGAAVVRADTARHLPLAAGDALAVAQSLPGTARAPAGSGALLIWGSTSDETRILIDDVPVPWLFHQGGLRSALSDALVGSIELVPAGFGPAQGRATGGLVLVDTAPLEKEGFGGSLGADFIDGQAALRYRQREGPHAAVVAGRYGWLSRLLPAVVDGIERVVPLPESWDYGGKWLFRPGGSQTQVSIFGAGDEVRRPFGFGGGERLTTSFHRAAVRHQQSLEGGASLEAGLWAGVDLELLRGDGSAEGVVRKQRALRGGVDLTLRHGLTSWLSLTLGLDVEGSRVELERAGSLSQPAREGDLRIFGQPPGDRLAFERWTTHALGLGAFAELELRLGRVLTLRPGVRLEPYVLEGQRQLPTSGSAVDVGYSRLDFFAEPRLSATFRPIAQLGFSAAVGLYHQPPSPSDLSAVFGNTSLGNATGVHAVLGATVQPLTGLFIEATGYFKSTQGLAARSSREFPAVAQALTSTGEGRSYGGQLVLRPATWRWLSGWVSYGLSRSERRAGPEGQWRLFDFDQTHQLLAVASVELPFGFRIGPRFRVASGFPRTPVEGAYFDARTGGYQPIRGAQNSERLPTFVQLDARAEKVFEISSVRLSLWLDVINVTNTRNAEEVVYSYDYQQEGYLTGLPVLAVLGARLEL